jgi:hypothetical protein
MFYCFESRHFIGIELFEGDLIILHTFTLQDRENGAGVIYVRIFMFMYIPCIFCLLIICTNIYIYIYIYYNIQFYYILSYMFRCVCIIFSRSLYGKICAIDKM